MQDRWVQDSTSRRRVSAIVRARREPCCICGERINYGLKWPDPQSFSVQHLQSRKARPDLVFDVLNCKAAHLDCNQSQGEEPIITERVTSRRW